MLDIERTFKTKVRLPWTVFAYDSIYLYLKSFVWSFISLKTTNVTTLMNVVLKSSYSVLEVTSK